MLFNYLKIVFRSLLRYKAFSLINITGLAVGMACCLMLLLYIQNELSYDTFHENADRIYRIVTEAREDGQVAHRATAPLPIIPRLKEIPEIQYVAHPSERGRLLIERGDQQFYKTGIGSANPDFFRVFSFPLLQGDPATALADPHTVVVTESLARTYFDEADPMGQVLQIEDQSYRITGILAPFPAHSRLQFDALKSRATRKAQQRERRSPALYEKIQANWQYSEITYVLLPEDVSPQRVETKLADMVNAMRAGQEDASYRLSLQPLTDIYLDPALAHNDGKTGDVQAIYVLSAIALLILLIACINFMNLSTARSARRAKEVGVRKVVGAHRRQLAWQFIGESIFFSALAMGLAIMLVEILLPLFNSLLGTALSFSQLGNAPSILGIVGITLLVGVLAGSYPALFLSGFTPISALRGKLHAQGGLNVRKALVIVQFAASVVLVIATGIIYNQLTYLQTKTLGFNKAQVLSIPIEERFPFATQSETILDELSHIPTVQNVTASMGTIGITAFDQVFQPDEHQKDNLLSYQWIGVDHNFIKTFELTLVEGRDFSKAFPTDVTDAFIVNETAVRALGWEDPIGQEIQLKLNDRKGTVIGVVKDFHAASLHAPIQPTLLFIKESFFYSHVYARLQPDQIAQAIAALEEKWTAFFPGRPFEYTFLDEEFARLYDAETRLGQIFAYASLLALFVACLGLFGLALFLAEQRTKEIGIRKVCGASMHHIFFQLSAGFVKLVLVSNVIAWPVAYLIMDRWLQDFAYHVDKDLTTFVLASVMALLLALGTVGYQSVKAARLNPADALRYE